MPFSTSSVSPPSRLLPGRELKAWHAVAQMLNRYKGSLDGRTDPDNPFVNEFAPWALQSTLVCQTSRFVAARVLAERDLVDKNLALQLNGLAIQALNHNLATEKIPSLETLAAIGQFIGIELYYGEPDVLQFHLRGIRQVVQLRGSFPQQGVGILIARNTLL